MLVQRHLHGIDQPAKRFPVAVSPIVCHNGCREREPGDAAGR